MSNFKKQRTAELLQAFLAEEIRRMEDPALFCVTLTGVDLSPDLRNAKVFWTVPPQPEKPGDAPSDVSDDPAKGFADPAKRKGIEQTLQSVVWHLKRRIAAELGLRYVPQLKFHYDESAATASRIEYLIRKATGSTGS